jgi:hypothetical protein
MYGDMQFFSSILLVEVEKNLLIRLVALYEITTVWRRGESEKHTHLPHQAGRGEAMGADA